MGTLGNQPPRQYCNVTRADTDDALDFVKELASKHKVSISDVIALMSVLEHNRANDIAVKDGDFRDEHAGGYGENMALIGEALGSIAQALHELHVEVRNGLSNLSS
ncbi:MAG: hypothetical protein KA535_03375 [Azonexus sp.]|nr:hypothetical protein [Azonexus sp.]